jgi:hypothetical protein
MERIGQEVERELARSGSRDALPLARLTEAWPTVVGDAIARQAWPVRIGRDGTLHVATASATWASELTLLGDGILDRLRERLGPEAPAALRCAVGPVPEPAGQLHDPAPSEPLEVPEDVRATASAVASVIEDPELREMVARAARASLAKAASDRHF